jgi:ATP-dependent DNA ligase
MIPRFKPMRLHQLRRPFDSPDWIFELKHDGFRALSFDVLPLMFEPGVE